jgi:hypothetical protein
MQTAVSDLVDMEGRMRKLLIIFAVTLLPSFAMAHGHGGGGHMGGGGRMGGWSGGHVGGAWGGSHSLAMAGGRVGGWHAANWHRAPFFRHGRFAHRHHRFFFVGGPVFAAYGYGHDCWRWVPTAWGVRRIWVCGDYY